MANLENLTPEQLEALNRLLEGFDRLTRQARNTGDVLEQYLGKKFQTSMEKAMRAAEDRAKADARALLSANKQMTEREKDQAIEMAGKRAAHTEQEKYNERVAQSRSALMAMGDATAKLTKRLYQGEQGAKVYADAMDELATAIGTLTFFLGGPLVKAITVLTLGFIKLTKAASEQSDALFKSFQTLQQSGANAADGLAGVFAMMQNFSYGIEDLDKMNSMIAENARSLAVFRGSVADGARAMSSVGREIKISGLRREFMNMGMTIPEINESIAGYIDIQSRVGATQTRDTKAITASIAGYIKETDAITRLTGATRKQQEAAQQKALNLEQFRYKYQKLMASNDPKQVAQGRKMLETFKMFSALGPGGEQLAEAYASMQTGIIREGAGLTATLISNGKAMEIVNDENLSAAGTVEALAGTIKGVIDPNRSGSLGQLAGWGGFKDITGADFGPMLDAIQAADKLQQRLKGVTNEQERLRIIQEAGVKAQVGMRITQMDSRDAMQSFVNLGVAPATQALETFSKVVEKITRLLPGGTTRVEAAKNIEKQKAAEKSVVEGTVPPAKTEKTQQEFYDKMYKTLLEQAKKEGVANPEAIARLGAAQSSLETGYGKSTARGNNYFGIKATKGQPSSRTVATQEYDPETGQYKTVGAKFRRYGSMEESAADYIKFLKENPRYAKVLEAQTPEEAILAQGRTGYATDPLYASKLASIHGGATVNGGKTEKMAEGGITKGVTIAGEAGPEAVVPLPDGRTIPVEMRGARLNGLGMDGSYMSGPMSTDTKLTDMIMERLGLTDFDSRRMINMSGVGTNYNIGGTELGSKIGGGVLQGDIADQVSKLVGQGQPLQDALNSTLADLRQALVDFASKSQGSGQLESMIGQLIDLQRNQNRTSERILQVNQN